MLGNAVVGFVFAYQTDITNIWNEKNVHNVYSRWHECVIDLHNTVDEIGYPYICEFMRVCAFRVC